MQRREGGGDKLMRTDPICVTPLGTVGRSVPAHESHEDSNNLWLSYHHLLLFLVPLQVGKALRWPVVDGGFHRREVLPVLILVRLHMLRMALLVSNRHRAPGTIHDLVGGDEEV